MGSYFKIEGTYTALVTPFKDDEAHSIDWPSLDALVDAQIEGGVDGLVPCGTTGESPALSSHEQAEVIGRVVERARKRVHVIAGTGTNATDETVARSKEAERAGADAVMVVVPYYNKPTQEGLYRHFRAAAQAVSCPFVVYNIPGRSVIDMVPDTLARLCDQAENVVAVKEATGNVLRAQDIVRRFGDRLSVMCGDDALTLPMLAIGARGVISVTSNLLPHDVSRVVKLALEGLFVEARHTHLALLPIHEAMFIEASPGPVKAALAMAGIIGGDQVRGPLAPATDATRAAIRAAQDVYRRSVRAR